MGGKEEYFCCLQRLKTFKILQLIEQSKLYLVLVVSPILYLTKYILKQLCTVQLTGVTLHTQGDIVHPS
jgi:hypothetical protein